MIRFRPFLHRLRRDIRGSVAIEFALVGPAFIALLMGVLQFGVAMQAYNAVRNVSADVARQVAVQYQEAAGNPTAWPSNGAVRLAAIGVAESAPYLLDRDNLRVSVINAPAQRITGAKEITLSIEYDVPTFMPLFGFEGPTISYERPIFASTT